MSKPTSALARAALPAVARWTRDDAGVTAIEYGLLASLIVIAAIAAFAATGGNLEALFGYWTGVVNAVIAGAL
jgi:pilus assembly protein Flp/PilA